MVSRCQAGARSVKASTCEIIRLARVYIQFMSLLLPVVVGDGFTLTQTPRDGSLERSRRDPGTATLFMVCTIPPLLSIPSPRKFTPSYRGTAVSTEQGVQ